MKYEVRMAHAIESHGHSKTSVCDDLALDNTSDSPASGEGNGDVSVQPDTKQKFHRNQA